MADLMLVTGGCRSGKSSYAQSLAESLPGARLYVATCPVIDDEMRRRIEVHRQNRAGRGWETVEELVDLPCVLRGSPEYQVVLVDCVTLWVNNLMYEAEQRGNEITEADVVSRCGELLAVAAERSGAVIFVTNEVGMGIVPDNAHARRYRDLVGRTNQTLAREAQTVILVSCGIPWNLKATRPS
jgi:adenosylcobinamide kinase/adenosylcobinamide-phosphate guanylyltransferase